MKILISPDSFKDAADSDAIGLAIESGFLAVDDSFNTKVCSLADGGEGTSLILNKALNGEWTTTKVVDPLNRPIDAGFAWIPDRKLAIIELAQASGYQLLKPHERNPMHTTTFGTGMLIRYAVSMGAEEVVLCIGSSATNDLATGLAAALGYRFYNDQGLVEVPRGQDLIQINRIEKTIDIDDIKFTVLCDVNNPLYGPSGAAHIYGPQKGASSTDIDKLDQGLRHMADLIQSRLGVNVHDVSGGGAAGGVGAGSLAFLNADLQPGIKTIKELIGFDKAVEWCDLIITGEGRLDQQTMSGKLIKGVIQSAQAYQKPVIAIAGEVSLSDGDIKKLGLLAAFSITNGARPLGEALPRTLNDVRHLSTQLASMVKGLVSVK